MKKIIPLIEKYKRQQESLIRNRKDKVTRLKFQIKEAEKLLNQLRINLRSTKFSNTKEEIQFFKHLKPSIYADLIFFSSQLKYHISKPNATNSILKNYLKNELKKLEQQKKKNIDFYSYYKHNSNFLDHLYFLRENKQLDLFNTELSVYLDSEFYTSHDTLAAEVMAYDLLTEFYKKEIEKLKRIESGVFNENLNTMNEPLKWTASKTDFIELMYALKTSGSINYGAINSKDLIEIFSKFFDLEITNQYKIYSDIKNRVLNRTKFLDKITSSLQEKLDYDDGI